MEMETATPVESLMEDGGGENKAAEAEIEHTVNIPSGAETTGTSAPSPTDVASATATATNNNNTVDGAVAYDKPIPKLYTIYMKKTNRNIKRRVMLKDLLRQQIASERKLSRKEGNLSSARTDLYQILALFFVFQGVILTAVSQTNQLKCINCFLPALLSLTASIATGVAAGQKLREATKLSNQCRLEKALNKAVNNSIDALTLQGASVALEDCVPDLPKDYKKPDPNIRWYTVGVFVVIVVFSVLTLVSVPLILCHYPR